MVNAVWYLCNNFIYQILNIKLNLYSLSLLRQIKVIVWPFIENLYLALWSLARFRREKYPWVRLDFKLALSQSLTKNCQKKEKKWVRCRDQPEEMLMSRLVWFSLLLKIFLNQTRKKNFILVISPKTKFTRFTYYSLMRK